MEALGAISVVLVGAAAMAALIAILIMIFNGGKL